MSVQALSGFTPQQLGVVVHRLVDHQVEELEDGHVVVDEFNVAAEDADALSAHRGVFDEDIRVVGELLQALLHLLLVEVVEVEHQEEGRLHEVGELFAIAIHLGGDGDAGTLWLVSVGEALADFESLAVGLSVDFQHRVGGEELHEILPTYQRMAFSGF